MSTRIVLSVTSAQSLRLLTGFPDYLAQRGWDVHIVCSDAPSDRTFGGTMHDLSMRRDPAPLADFISLVRWITLLRRLRPQIVVAGTPKAGLLGTVAAALTRVPTRVYLLRGLRSSTQAGPQRTLLQLLEVLTMKAATDVQSVSESLKAEVVALGLTRSEDVHVVGEGSSNGVELASQAEVETSSQDRRSALGLPDRPTIGFIGRLHPDKGLSTLVGAFALIAAEHDAQLLLVGSEEPAGQYQAARASLPDHAQDRIIWVGRKDDPTPYYRAMDVFCLPSKREGFPNVVLEAASRAVPTVASDVTGCRDAVQHELTGLLFEPGDDRALAAAVGRLLHDGELRESLGARARSWVDLHFARTHVWEQLETYYRSLTTAQINKEEKP